MRRLLHLCPDPYQNKLQMNIQVGDIGHIIQLAIAPVFLLTGVCTKLMVLTNRLARIIDRSRVLEDRLDVGYNENSLNELDVLYRRSHLRRTASTPAERSSPMFTSTRPAALD